MSLPACASVRGVWCVASMGRGLSGPERGRSKGTQEPGTGPGCPARVEIEATDAPRPGRVTGSHARSAMSGGKADRVGDGDQRMAGRLSGRGNAPASAAVAARSLAVLLNREVLLVGVAFLGRAPAAAADGGGRTSPGEIEPVERPSHVVCGRGRDPGPTRISANAAASGATLSAAARVTTDSVFDAFIACLPSGLWSLGPVHGSKGWNGTASAAFVRLIHAHDLE